MRKWFFLWLYLLILTSPLVGQAPDLATAGLALQRKGDLSGAARDYQQFLQTYPNQPAVWTNLGVIRAQQGRFDEAIAAYKSALKADSTFSAAHLNLALAYYKEGDVVQARRQLLSFRSAHGDDLRTALLLADCDLRLGHNREVVSTMSSWEEKAPDNLAIAYLLGTAAIRLGRMTQGQQFIQKIMAHGDSAEVHMMLGDAYSHAHRLKKAAGEFARAAALVPNLPQVHLRLGLTDLMIGDSPAAFVQFEDEYKNNPNSFDANFYLGVMYKNRGELSLAQPYLERSHSMRPDAVGPVLQLGLLAYEQRRYPQARASLEWVVKRAPDTVQAHVILGEVYYRLHLPQLGMAERKTVARLNAMRQKANIQQREQVSVHLNPLQPDSGKGPSQ